MAYGSSQARGQIRATAARLRHSHRCGPKKNATGVTLKKKIIFFFFKEKTKKKKIGISSKS